MRTREILTRDSAVPLPWGQVDRRADG